MNSNVGNKGCFGREDEEQAVPFLHSLLLDEWEDHVQRGLFRYDVAACETKLTVQPLNYIEKQDEGGINSTSKNGASKACKNDFISLHINDPVDPTKVRIMQIEELVTPECGKMISKLVPGPLSREDRVIKSYSDRNCIPYPQIESIDQRKCCASHWSMEVTNKH